MPDKVESHIEYDFTMIKNEVIETKEFDKSIDKLVYITLLRYTFGKGHCFPSLKTIADDCLISSKKTLRDSLKRLVERGYIKIESRTTKQGDADTNIYHIYDVKAGVGQKLTHGRSKINPGVGQKLTPNNKYLKNKNKKERRTNKFDDAQLNLANELLKLIKQNNPNYKEPANIGTWANEIRLMMEQDKRTFKQIDYLIKWSQKNDFWSANCLSARSLRKHFDQMVAQCKREHKRKPIHVVPTPASRDIPSVEETMIMLHGPNWREERKKVVGINRRE